MGTEQSEERSKNGGYANTHVYSALILLEYVIFYLLEYILKAGTLGGRLEKCETKCDQLLIRISVIHSNAGVP